MRKNFCSLPFIHTAIEANGDIKGCCLTPAFLHPDGRPLNLNYDDFSTALNSAPYLEFIEAFKRDERHPNCQECWSFDDDQTVSNRVKFTESTRELSRDLSMTQPKRSLRFLEIKIGNSCNLKCRICGPHNSSKAAQEAADLGFDDNPLQHTELSRWIHRPEIWQQISAIDWEYIHLMGGEPFLDKTHIPMLQALVDSGRARAIGLWYNTNGTVFPEALIPLLAQFKSVHLSLSLDDIGPRFEYQRFPGKWASVQKNLERFFALPKPQFTVHVDICWSIFNLYFFDEIMEFYQEFYAARGIASNNTATGRHFYTGGDAIFCPKVLRPEQKEHFVERLMSSRFAGQEPYSSLLRDLIQHIKVGQFRPDLERLRKERVAAIDAYRGQSFAQVFPDLTLLGLA